jgi:hypothetical protein
MNNSRLLSASVLGLFIPLACSVAYPSTQRINKKQLLGNAQQKYYNLKRAGLVELESNVQPNWDVVLGPQTNAATLKLLNAIHFSIVIDSQSTFNMFHRTDDYAAKQKAVGALDPIYLGMHDAVSRFISTWSIFMLTSPFPDPESECEIEQTADQIRFSRKEHNNQVTTVTNKDFSVSEITVVGEDFTASLKPVLETTATGYILKGYSSDYRTSSGARETRLKVSVDYQEIKGLQLPHKVYVETVYEKNPAQIEWLFTDYRVRVR